MPKLRLNRRNIDRLKPTDKRQTFQDEDIRNLYLRVTPAGTRSFYLKKMVNGKNKWYWIGTYPDWHPESARDEARRLLTGISQGDTLEIDDPRTATVRYTLEDYLAKKNLRPQSANLYREDVQRDLADWLDKPLHSITRKMVSDRHHQISQRSPSKADAVFRAFRALFNFAKAQYRDARDKPLYPDNPASVLSDSKQWNNVKRKKTYVDEIRQWLQEIEALQPVHRDYLEVLLFTGLRGSAVLELRSEAGHIDKNGEPCPVYDSRQQTISWLNKNNEWTEIPVSDHVASILGRQPALDGWIFDTTLSRLRKDMKRRGITASRNDLRRTFSTVAESLDLNPTTIKRLLGHTTQERDVTVGYMVSVRGRLKGAAEQISEKLTKANG